MQQQSIARALVQIRENLGLTREEALLRVNNLGLKRSLSGFRRWEVTGSIQLDDAKLLIERVYSIPWADFEAEVERQEKRGRPRARKPKPPQSD